MRNRPLQTSSQDAAEIKTTESSYNRRILRMRRILLCGGMLICIILGHQNYLFAQAIPTATIALSPVAEKLIRDLSEVQRNSLVDLLQSQIETTRSARAVLLQSRGQISPTQAGITPPTAVGLPNSAAQAIKDIAVTKSTISTLRAVPFANPTVSAESARQVEELVMSLTRPTWLVCNGNAWPSKNDPEGWTGPINSFTNLGHTAIENVGRLELFKVVDGREIFINVLGTAFAVGSRQLITNRHVLEQIVARPLPSGPFKLPRDFRLKFNTGGEYDRCPIHVLNKYVNVPFVALVGSALAEDFAILVTEPNSLLTAVRFSETAPGDGVRVAVVGFPGEPAFQVDGLRQDQIAVMFSVPGGTATPFLVKRVSPGRTMGVLSDKGSRSFAYNANTVGGNSGSAVFSMDDGSVVGLHIGGVRGDQAPLYNFALSAPELTTALQAARTAISQLLEERP